MALEGTHIQVASEFITDLNIQKVDQYISGTIYPDTRYPTGVDRELTHPQEYRITADLDDFTKGWYLHLLCDQVQFDIFNKDCDAYLVPRDDPYWWHQRTALKIIQDILVFDRFDYQEYLDGLTYMRNPFGEDIEIIRRYNQMVYDMYKDKDHLTLDDARRCWEHLGVLDERLNTVLVFAQQFLEDNTIVNICDGVYIKMIQQMRLLL